MADTPVHSSRDFYTAYPVLKAKFKTGLWKLVNRRADGKEEELQRLLKDFFDCGSLDLVAMTAFSKTTDYRADITHGLTQNIALTKVLDGVPFSETYMYQMYFEYKTEELSRSQDVYQIEHGPRPTAVSQSGYEAAYASEPAPRRRVSSLQWSDELSGKRRSDIGVETSNKKHRHLNREVERGEDLALFSDETSNTESTLVDRKIDFLRGVIMPDLTGQVEVKSRTDGSDVTRLLTYAFECKYSIQSLYSDYLALTRVGTAQQLCYSSTSFQTSGMWLGTIFINTSFTRISALGVTDFLIEVSDTVQLSSELENKILEAFKQSHGRMGDNLSLDQLLEVLDEIPQVEIDQLLRDDGLPAALAWELLDSPPTFDSQSQRVHHDPDDFKVNEPAWETLLGLRDLVERITLDIPISGPLRRSPTCSHNDRLSSPLLTSFEHEDQPKLALAMARGTAIKNYCVTPVSHARKIVPAKFRASAVKRDEENNGSPAAPGGGAGPAGGFGGRSAGGRDEDDGAPEGQNREGDADESGGAGSSGGASGQGDGGLNEDAGASDEGQSGERGGGTSGAASDALEGGGHQQGIASGPKAS